MRVNFDTDHQITAALKEIKSAFNAESNAQAMLKALSFARVAASHAFLDENGHWNIDIVTAKGPDTGKPLRIVLSN